MGGITRRQLLGGLVAGVASVACGVWARVGLERASAATNSVFLPFVTKGYQPPTPTATPTTGPSASPTSTQTMTPAMISTATPIPTATTTPTPLPSSASSVFRIDNIPTMIWGTTDATATHPGIEALLDMMAQNGLAFYQSSSGKPRTSPTGIIGNRDIVLVKVNVQWQERGMTSTDVVRGLVRSITAHPDGFVGEVVIVDNGQNFGNHFSDPSGNNDDYPTHSQSFQTVANLFSAQNRVSTYDWSLIATEVQEWSQGDSRNGYVLAANYPLNYPKFTTAYGTRISAKLGIWDGSSYNSGTLKLINVPVLKAHGMFGMTGAVKHFVGFMSRFVGLSQANSDNWVFHNGFTQTFNGLPPGITGSLMNLRYPDLNIIDATYVSPLGNTSWNARYDLAVHQATLLASQDPVAVDYYATKYILLPSMVAAGQSTSLADPDQNTVCRGYLLASQARLQEAGRTVRFGEGGYSVLSYRLP